MTLALIGQIKTEAAEHQQGYLTMSVAFTREEDVESAAAHVPDRPISAHANLVTREGLDQLEQALSAARTAYAALQASGQVQADRSGMAIAARDLRYYSARRASAQLTEPDRSAGTVVFGARVTLDRHDGRRQVFRIVGEDEADARNGSVSYVSPLAHALLGKRAGDTVSLAGKDVHLIAVD